MERILELGSLVWAAVAKDPGFTPLSLLEQLKRRGRYRPEQTQRLDLAEPFDLVRAKEYWLNSLANAEAFVEAMPPEEAGCLYYAAARERFDAPRPGIELAEQGLVPHYGRPGGVLPRPADQRIGGEA